MGQIRQRGREIDPEVYIELRRMAMETKSSAPQIEAELHRQFSPKRKVPSQKVIQRVVKEERPQDTTGPWRLADAASLDDAALVLPVTIGVSRELSRWQLTKKEAEWVVRIRKAAPNVPLGVVFTLVRAYMSWKQRGRPTDVLDLVLASRPWRSTDARETLERFLADHGEEGQEAIRIARLTEMADHVARLDARAQLEEDERKEHLIDYMLKEPTQQKEDKGHERALTAKGKQVGRRGGRGPRRKRET